MSIKEQMRALMVSEKAQAKNKYLSNCTSWIMEDQSGKATVWAMLACVCIMTAYLRAGRVYLESILPSVHTTTIAIVLMLMCIFTLGCALHMMFVGERSQSRQQKDIEEKIHQIRCFVEEAFQHIAYLEDEAKFYRHQVRPFTFETLTQANRIVQAIALRADEVDSLLAQNTRVGFVEAHELMFKDLEVVENCVNSLIQAEPIPAIPAAEWVAKVERLLQNASDEVERVRFAA